MKKVIIIGCPGAGKSTFARELNQITNLPLYYLDMIFHKPDKTTVSREEFDAKLEEIIKKDKWIIDGNYARTLQVRVEQCDTIIWLKYPVELCLAGIEARQGKERIDMPWIETEPDEEFIEYVKKFEKEQYSEIEEILSQATGKEIHIFSSREMAEEYLHTLQRKETDLC